MWKQLQVFAACVLAIGVAAQECDRRWYNYSSCVCACSAEHCDTPRPLRLNRLPAAGYVAYMSSMKGARLQHSGGTLLSEPPQPPLGAAILLVNGSDLRHEIVGFGAAMTDAAAINIASLSPGAQRNLLKEYFSPEGSGYTIVRVPIAGTDFSDRYYTYNDVNSSDPHLEYFKLTAEDFQLKIPYLGWARDMSPRDVRLLASAWTAPAWMKSSKKRLRSDCYQAWADYYVRFMEAYDEQGLRMWAVTGQNEPVLGGEDIVIFNSMTWTDVEQAAWLSRNLGPSLRRAGFGDVHVFALDDQRPFMPQWADTMFGDEKVSRFLTGMAVHWYFDNSSDPDIISQVHSRYPDKMLLYTEACDGPFMSPGAAVQLGSWERGENYTSDIIAVLSRGVAGWLEWNMALDLLGGPTWAFNNVDSSIIVNASADEFYKQPMYYAITHFSRYVPPGSRVVGVRAQGRDDLEHIAFVTPEQATVIVLQNRNEEDIECVITDAMAGSIEMTVPARSVHTIIYKA